jgi:hypothetical protein
MDDESDYSDPIDIAYFDALAVSDEAAEPIVLDAYRRSNHKEFTISVGWRDYRFPVFRNPTASDYQVIRSRNRLEDGTSLLRSTYDETGNRYVWNAYDGMHGDVEPILTKMFGGIEFNQQNWVITNPPATIVKDSAGNVIPLSKRFPKSSS